MDCPTARENLSPLIDDALPAAQADEVRGHLRFCAGCSKAHESLRELSRRVKALGAAALPAGFRERLERRRREGSPSAAPMWTKAVPALALAAVAVMVILNQRRKATPLDRADEELRVAMKRAPELPPPPMEAAPKRKAAAPEYSNESQAAFLAQQRDELGIQSVGAERAMEDAPPPSMFGGSITDPERKPEVDAAMRRMAAISRSIRERAGTPEVPIMGTQAPVLAKQPEGAAGDALLGAGSGAWSGTHSRNLEGTRTIGEAAEWKKLWPDLSQDPLPAVDFKTSQVVGVFVGPRPTGGYAVEIIGAIPTATALIVQWMERAPQDGMLGPEGATSPWALKVVPRTDLPVRYQKLK